MSVDDLFKEFAEENEKSEETKPETPEKENEEKETDKQTKPKTAEELDIKEIIDFISKNEGANGVIKEDISNHLTHMGYDISVEKLDDILFNIALEGDIYSPQYNFFKINYDNQAPGPKKEEISKPEEKVIIKEDKEQKKDDDLSMEELLGVELTGEPSGDKPQSGLVVKKGDGSISDAKKGRLMVWTPENIPKQFIIYFNDIPYILKAGLLWLGHQVGVREIKPKMVENSWDNEEGRAIYDATVKTTDGNEYTSRRVAIPNAKNVKNKKMYAFIDAFAETRAICSALRLATNCGFVSAEEMPDYDGPID